MQKCLLVCLAALVLSTGCSKVDFYTNLPEQEANEMMGILLQRGISCEKSAGDEAAWNLSVSRSDFSQAVTLLKTQGYPHETFSGMGDVFQKSGLVSSPTEERIRFMHALSQELSSTISQIDGVLVARVHIVLPRESPFGDELKPASASVYIKYQTDADMEEKIPQIQDLVVNGVEGLELDNVATVVDRAEPPAAVDLAEGPELVSVLSVKIAPESVQRFWMLVGGLVAALVAVVVASFAMLNKEVPKAKTAA